MSKVVNILDFKRPAAPVEERKTFAEAVVTMALNQPEFKTKCLVFNGFKEVDKIIERAMVLKDKELIEILDRMGFLDPNL